MGKNIYSFGGDEDADVFETDAEATTRSVSHAQHAFDGTMCPKCNVIHDITKDGEIPDAVMDKVGKLIDQLPDGEKGSSIIIAPQSRLPEQLLKDFIDFSRGLESVNVTGPLLRAVSEVLDSMSQGEVSRRWRLYQTEQQLMTAHVLLKAISTFSESIKNRSQLGFTEVDDSVTAIEKLLDNLLVICTDKCNDMVSRYRAQAGELGREVDEKLIAEGDFTSTEPFAAEMMTARHATELAATVEEKMGSNKPEGT